MKTNKASSPNSSSRHTQAGFSRRFFIRTSTTVLAATALPKWFLDEHQASAATRPLGPNDQPAIALVGCGGMGRGDLNNASRFGRVVAVCDVDESHIAEVKKKFPDATGFKDFRKLMERDDIHVIINGTPDHWHTLVNIAAVRAGKDVYSEKPLTLTIDEGKRLVQEIRKHKRILQTGSQQRSDRRFRLACELVRNGRIGKLQNIQVWIPAGRHGGPFATQPVPAGLDWELWQGQAPRFDYVRERCHGLFRYWWEYSGGTMTDWGAHHNDIALWGAGFERSGPVEIEGKPLVKMIPGGFSAFSQYEVHYKYENGVTQMTRSTIDDDPAGGVVQREGKRHGVKFEGTDGWIWVTRGEIEASKPDLLQEALPSSATRLYVSNDHMNNLFECIRSRKEPICEVEIGHRSVSVCHLGMIAARLGRKLKWDPKAEQFVGDKEANGMVAREMHKPWGYDAV